MIGDGALLETAVSLGLGVIGGAGGTLVAMRTALASMKRDIKDEGVARAVLEASLAERIDSVNRRQMIMLKLLADVARKVGVEARHFDDALVRMLTDETP